MRPLFHRYQVKVIQTKGSRPIVQGLEEVTVNGQRRVRYFDQDTDWSANSWFDTSFDWRQPLPIFDDVVSVESRSPRRIRLEPDSQPAHRGLGAMRDGWQRSQRRLKNIARQVTRIVHNVPAALAAAWRELSR